MVLRPIIPHLGHVTLTQHYILRESVDQSMVRYPGGQQAPKSNHSIVQGN